MKKQDPLQDQFLQDQIEVEQFGADDGAAAYALLLNELQALWGSC